MSSSTNKKIKILKPKTKSNTPPADLSQEDDEVIEDKKSPEQSICPLAAKDSEWVDIMQASDTDPVTCTNASDVQEVVLEDSGNGPQIKPLAKMFPGLLNKDPNTLEGMLNKVMSTTEVTQHLVDLGQRANFSFMKKAEPLIPKDKQWLERLTECSNSFNSLTSTLLNSSGVSSDYDADNEITSSSGLGDEEASTIQKRNKSKTFTPRKCNSDRVKKF